MKASAAPRRLFSTTAAWLLPRCSFALLLVERQIGQEQAFPAEGQPTVRKVVNLNILPGDSLGGLVAYQDEKLAVIGHRQLLADVAQLAMAQDAP